MKKINLIPLIEGCGLPQEVLNDFEEYGMSFHDNGEVVYIGWDDEDYPNFKKWLRAEYGEDIKKFDYFAINEC